MKGLVKVPFTDKYTLRYYAKGKEVDFTEERLTELAKIGYVEKVAEAKPSVAKATKRTVKKTVKKK